MTHPDKKMTLFLKGHNLNLPLSKAGLTRARSFLSVVAVACIQS